MHLDAMVGRLTIVSRSKVRREMTFLAIEFNNQKAWEVLLPVTGTLGMPYFMYGHASSSLGWEFGTRSTQEKRSHGEKRRQ
jgi:hypothetical protein